MTNRLFRIVSIPALALTVGVLAAPSIAQTQAAPQRTERPRAARPQAGQLLTQQLQQLELTPEQKTRIDSITENLRKELRESRTSTTDPTQRRQAMRTAAQTAHQQINEILTPEQRTKLAALMSERRGPATQPIGTGAGAGQGRGAMIGRLEGIAMGLNLSAEQQTQVRDLTKEYRDEMAAVLRDRGGQGSRQQLQTVMAEYRSRLTQLLTPEQTDQFHAAVGKLALETPGRGAGQGQGPRQQRNRPNRQTPANP